MGIGVCLTKHHYGISQYSGFDFNSLCVFNGQYIGVSESGVFLLEGDSDNGADIDAFVELPNTDLGDSRQKRARSALIGYEADGDLELTVTLDETTEQTHTLRRNIGSQAQQSGMVPLNRTQPGRYVQMKSANVGGCDFALDQVAIKPTLTGRKPR